MTAAAVEAQEQAHTSHVEATELPPPSAEEARGYVRRMMALGAHLMPLVRGEKRPAARGWPHLPPMTEDDAVQHLTSGGNLGVNVGRSHIAVLDSENSAATKLLEGAGLIPTVVPAKAQLPSGKKRGGAHFWLAVPDDLPEHLRSADLQLRLPNGGVLDYLAGHADGSHGRYAVAPPSRIDEAPGCRYAIAAGGALAGETPQLQAMPRWLYDPAITTPTPGADQLREALLANPEAGPRRGWDDEGRDELTEAIDGVSWPEWLAGDTRLGDTGQVDACGCDVYRWHTAENAKSVTLHDGCAWGYGAHIWSGTMQADLDVTAHCSRLTLAAALRGCSVTEAAAEHGIELRRSNLHVITPESFEEDAEKLEAAGDAEGAASRREAAESMRAEAAKRVGASAETTFRVSGGVGAPPLGGDDAGSDGAAEDAAAAAEGDVEGDVSNDGDSENAALAELFAELPDPYAAELEEAVFDFLPQTKPRSVDRPG